MSLASRRDYRDQKVRLMNIERRSYGVRQIDKFLVGRQNGRDLCRQARLVS